MSTVEELTIEEIKELPRKYKEQLKNIILDHLSFEISPSSLDDVVYVSMVRDLNGYSIIDIDLIGKILCRVQETGTEHRIHEVIRAIL